MHSLILFSGTRIARLPKVSGKACVELVGSLWVGRGQKNGVLHTHNFTQKALWKTYDFSWSLYTNCIHLYTATVGKITSVMEDLYTQYTPLTTMTTTYINTFRRIA